MNNDLLTMNCKMSENPIYIYNSNGDRIDISTEPLLPGSEIPQYMDNTTRKGKAFEAYTYNGIAVPRVTSILEYTMGNREYLMKWAAKLGPEYISTKRHSLDVGSKIHEVIAEYMTNGTLYTIQHLRGPIKEEVTNCFRNFLAWYNHIKRLGWKIEVVASEIPLICPWFAGTADLIVIINGRKYVIDFKSSKSISPDYLIQVSAYKWIIDNYYPEYGVIDGVGILRFDKHHDTYQDLFLDVSDPKDYHLICHCQQIFSWALNLFYSMNVVTKEISDIKNDKRWNKGRISKTDTSVLEKFDKKKGKEKWKAKTA